MNFSPTYALNTATVYTLRAVHAVADYSGTVWNGWGGGKEMGGGTGKDFRNRFFKKARLLRNGTFKVINKEFWVLRGHFFQQKWSTLDPWGKVQKPSR